MLFFYLNVTDENTDQNWRLYSQNYYFPSMDSYSAIPAGLVIAFCASFGIVLKLLFSNNRSLKITVLVTGVLIFAFSYIFRLLPNLFHRVSDETSA